MMKSFQNNWTFVQDKLKYPFSLKTKDDIEEIEV